MVARLEMAAYLRAAKGRPYKVHLNAFHLQGRGLPLPCCVLLCNPPEGTAFRVVFYPVMFANCERLSVSELHESEKNSPRIANSRFYGILYGRKGSESSTLFLRRLP